MSKFPTLTKAEREWWQDGLLSVIYDRDPDLPHYHLEGNRGRSILRLSRIKRIFGLFYTGVECCQSGGVDAKHWRKLFEIAERARRLRKGGPVKKGTRIGPYTVYRTYANGDVRVGCQKLPYWEIVRVMCAIEALTVQP